MAVRSGMEAALLARGGLTGPATIFEGRRGVMRLFVGDFEPDPDWGSTFQIMDAIFKLYPAVGTVHAPIDALRMVMEKRPFSADSVQRIRVGMAAWAIPHGAAIVHPWDPVSAQFSLAFSLALRIVTGDNDLSAYLDSQCWSDPRINALADLVVAEPMDFAPGASQLGATVEVTLRDGETLCARADTFRGQPARPASKGELAEKFFRLATEPLGEARARRLFDLIDHLEDLEDLDELTSLLAPGA
jgi:2-methylcitrate dehydratase PrpD